MIVLPACNIRLPIAVVREVLAEDIRRLGRRFLRDVHEVHVRLFHFTPALAVIARRASRYQIRPNVLTTHVTRDDVINGQVEVVFAAILTGIIVAAEYFAAR